MRRTGSPLAAGHRHPRKRGRRHVERRGAQGDGVEAVGEPGAARAAGHRAGRGDADRAAGLARGVVDRGGEPGAIGLDRAHGGGDHTGGEQAEPQAPEHRGGQQRVVGQQGQARRLRRGARPPSAARGPIRPTSRPDSGAVTLSSPKAGRIATPAPSAERPWTSCRKRVSTKSVPRVPRFIAAATALAAPKAGRRKSAAGSIGSRAPALDRYQARQERCGGYAGRGGSGR